MVDLKDEKKRKELGSKNRKARLKAKLTQAEVAEEAGILVNYYARVERGEENPSFEKLNGVLFSLL